MGPVFEKGKAASVFRWPDSDGPWEITLWWAPVEGRMECVGIDIRSFRQPRKQHLVGSASQLPGTDPQAVSTSLLRSLPLGRILEAKRTDHAGLASEMFREEPSRRWHAPKRRRAKYGPEHFAEVARVYREAFTRNRTPTRAVARHFEVSPTAAAKWVVRCRDLGLLPKTTRGRARSVEPGTGKRRRKK